jgi:hypothetical protein
MCDQIVDYINKLIDHREHEARVLQDKLKDYEATGRRLVTGGSPYCDQGGRELIAPWSDYRTGENLHLDGPKPWSLKLQDEMEAVYNSEQAWLDAEWVEQEVWDEFYTLGKGITSELPPSLEQAILEWVDEDLDEARRFADRDK